MRTSRYFVAEVYDPECAAADRTGRVAAELAGQGAHVCLLESLFSPDDELSLHLFEADSAETVAEVGHRASTPFDRIWPAERLAAPRGPPHDDEGDTSTTLRETSIRQGSEKQ